MTNFEYDDSQKRGGGLGGTPLDWDAADLRALLVMQGTTAHTERDSVTLSDFTDLDELTGSSNYARVTITGEALAFETSPDRKLKLNVDPVVWSALDPGDDQIKGMVVYLHVDGTAANDRPLFWIDEGGFPHDPDGSKDLQVTFPGALKEWVSAA